jgi:hypothetical protein
MGIQNVHETTKNDMNNKTRTIICATLQVTKKLRLLIDEEVAAQIKDAVITTVADMNVNPGEENLTEDRKAQVVFDHFERVDVQKKGLLKKFVASLFPPCGKLPGTSCITKNKY